MALGRGLGALLGEPPGSPRPGFAGARAERQLPVEALVPNPYQPRRIFPDEDIDSLARSIRSQGMLQAILVRPDPMVPNRYQIVAGERRWRAAQKAQLHEVPVLVLQLSDRDVLQVALIENVQREDLNPLEEAEGYRKLVMDFGNSQEAVAEAVGKSRSHVANMVRLLGLPGPVKQMIDARKLTMGHGRALLGAEDPAALAQVVVARGLNVRQTERLVARSRAPARPAPPEAKDPNTAALENDLSIRLGLEVKIRPRGEGGSLSITYKSLDQLDEVVRRLTRADPANDV